MGAPRASQATKFSTSRRRGLSSRPLLNPFSPNDWYFKISLWFWTRTKIIRIYHQGLAFIYICQFLASGLHSSLFVFFLCCWRRKWQTTLVFLPGKPHGQRSLVVHGLTTSWTQLSIHSCTFASQDPSIKIFPFFQKGKKKRSAVALFEKN